MGDTQTGIKQIAKVAIIKVRSLSCSIAKLWVLSQGLALGFDSTSVRLMGDMQKSSKLQKDIRTPALVSG